MVAEGILQRYVQDPMQWEGCRSLSHDVRGCRGSCDDRRDPAGEGSSRAWAAKCPGRQRHGGYLRGVISRGRAGRIDGLLDTGPATLSDGGAYGDTAVPG